MNDEQLQNLLRSADRDANVAPALSAETLLTAALRRRRHAAGVRVTFATLAIGCVALAGTWMTTSTVSPQNVPIVSDAPQHSSSPAELLRELARLEREAQLHLTVAQGLAPVSSNAVDSNISMDSDAELVRLEAARSAALSWQYATLVEQDFRDPAAARREYQRVATRFPGTPWADLAMTSLKRLPEPQNPHSL